MRRNAPIFPLLAGLLALGASPGAPSHPEEPASLQRNRIAVSIMERRLSDARVWGALIYLDLDKPVEAEAEAREALRLVPDSLPARSALAQSLFRGNRFAEAAALFKELAELKPGDPDVVSSYIESLLGAGDLREARRVTEEARRALPKVPFFDFCLARIEAREGRRSEAMELLTRCAAREPATRDWLEKVDDFDAYRGDPKLEALRK